jgi:hypothetical protein
MTGAGPSFGANTVDPPRHASKAPRSGSQPPKWRQIRRARPCIFLHGCNSLRAYFCARIDAATASYDGLT